MEELPKTPNQFTSKTIKNSCTRFSCNAFGYFELSTASREVLKKSLLSADTSKPAGIVKVPAKFLKGGAEFLPFTSRNVINLSIRRYFLAEKGRLV